MNARLAKILLGSRANGPGDRDVFWFSGCTIGCRGCVNPGFLEGAAGRSVPVDALARLFTERAPAIEGITLSGGEPTEQPEAAVALATAARGLGLSVVMFSGRTASWLREKQPALHDACDLIVAGPYVEHLPSRGPLLGSANQEVVFVTDRYRAEDLVRIPRAEVHLGGRHLSVTGIG